MTKFHAVFIDETGQGEFGTTITARSKAAAYDKARENYPESRLVQLESPADTRKREKRLYDDANRDYWGDY